MPKQVLVVDDGGMIADTLRSQQSQHYAIQTVDRQGVLGKVGNNSPDLLILDGLSAPAQTVELARHLRHHASGAKVVAVVPSVDLGCDQGGVTCLTQVPTEDELVAWLSEDSEVEGRFLRVDQITLDLETRQLHVSDKTFALTPKQFKLLRLFMSHPGQILTRKQLMKEVWDTDYTGDTRTLDVHIHWVREKLGDVPGQPKYLQTVRHVGYRFVGSNHPPE